MGPPAAHDLGTEHGRRDRVPATEVVQQPPVHAGLPDQRLQPGQIVGPDHRAPVAGAAAPARSTQRVNT